MAHGKMCSVCKSNKDSMDDPVFDCIEAFHFRCSDRFLGNVLNICQDGYGYNLNERSISSALNEAILMVSHRHL